jgi:hypothetical protein
MGRNLNWRIVAAKARGTSHEISNESCQDYYVTGTLMRNNVEHLYCFVSDGAGSSPKGGEGAEITCEWALQYFKESMHEFDGDVPIYELVESIIAEINRVAVIENHDPKDFACTLIGIIVNDTFCKCFQIGDGGIVIGNSLNEIGLHIVFWPDSGEYANTTNFVTDENAIGNLRIKSFEYLPDKIAIFTDGLQRLCLEYEKKIVHSPFFEKMFEAIRNKTNKDELERLNVKLEEFLESPQVNSRTDDDKTLVLSLRTDFPINESL